MKFFTRRGLFAKYPSSRSRQTAKPRRKRLSTVWPCIEALEDRTVPTTFTVNTASDILGHDSGLLSLRQAIIDANTNPNSGGPDTIAFNIPGAGVHIHFADVAIAGNHRPGGH